MEYLQIGARVSLTKETRALNIYPLVYALLLEPNTLHAVPMGILKQATL